MARDPMSVSADELLKHMALRVKITGVKKLLFRLWLGKCLLKLAARALNCGITIEMVMDH